MTGECLKIVSSLQCLGRCFREVGGSRMDVKVKIGYGLDISVQGTMYKLCNISSLSLDVKKELK